MESNPNGVVGKEAISGLFVRGVVMSSEAKAFNRKDGTGKVVCIRHELALQPGLAILEQYPELREVKLEGDKVVDFPKYPQFKQITLKVTRWEERDKRMVIKEAQLMPA